MINKRLINSYTESKIAEDSNSHIGEGYPNHAWKDKNNVPQIFAIKSANS